jgi:hypothetical protein
MFRSDLWVAAFVRRHNDIGNICVVARRGDPIAGQIFIEIDHLNGTGSLLTPVPSAALADGEEDRLFVRQLDHVDPASIRARIEREADFDTDLWVIAIETRSDDVGARLVTL